MTSADPLLRLKWPELTDNYQVEFVESRNDLLQDVINGMLTALVVIGPIAVILP